MSRRLPKSPVAEPNPRKEQIERKTLTTRGGTFVRAATTHPIVVAAPKKLVIALRTVSASQPHIATTGNGIHCMDGSATMGNFAPCVDTRCVISVPASKYLVGKLLPIASLDDGF